MNAIRYIHFFSLSPKSFIFYVLLMFFILQILSISAVLICLDLYQVLLIFFFWIQSCFSQYFFHVSGLLWILLKQGEAVSVLMDGPGDQHSAGGSQDSQNPSQNQEQQCTDRCPLPLILKKVSVQTSCPPPQPGPLKTPYSGCDNNHNKRF